MMTLKSYVPWCKRSRKQVIIEAMASIIMFVVVWICLVLVLALDPN